MKSTEYPRLSPQNTILFDYMYSNKGRITARGANDDLQMTSATLASRVCEMKASGIDIKRKRLQHPVTKKRYTEYQLVGIRTR